METNKHYFYVLKCRDDSYYAGYTNNLERRINMHNQGKGAKYTRGRIPVELIYHETFENQTLAMQAEYQFKQLTRKQKEQWMAKEET
ncbi:GIY-YIG nuclease family protein [Peribacillus sp. NPDC097295]|uniref:GIY-YIG nuclease family protein n=1 Tax=Peribacillus sp. NPDC097295 TaxID=3364402 RepID=UPI0037F137A2